MTTTLAAPVPNGTARLGAETPLPGVLAGLRRRRLETLQRENTELNLREFAQKRIVLSSTPQTVFLQINAVCNADCVFCSKGYDYPLFRIDDYLSKYGRQVVPVLRRARQVILTGSGEFLGLPDAPGILRFFNGGFPHVDKYIATNASHLKPEVVELIAGSDSRYTLQLSLHGSDRETHKLMMRYNAYDRVMENVRHLMELRRSRPGTTVNFMFVMTTLNVENLPDFIRFAKEMGADRVLAGYFYIYESQQKYLSLFFRQELANRMIDEARRVAEELGMPVGLPHKFGQGPAPGADASPDGAGDRALPRAESCSEAWHQVMLNPDGAVLPCDVYGAFHEHLDQKPFADIWNGPTYRSIRRALAKGGGCLTTCPRHNPAGINDWRSHVIHRPKDERQIAKEYREALRKP